MKKMILVLLLVMLLTPVINAAQQSEHENNKIGSDSLFYFLDRTGEKINLFFASDKEKAKLKLKHGYERLVEAKEMIKKDDLDEAKKLLKEGLRDFSEATKLATEDLITKKEWQKIKTKFKDLMRTISQEIIESDFNKRLENFFTD